MAAFVIGNERDAKEHAIAERQKSWLDPMSLYQDGFQVASIIEPRTDVVANTIVFPVITASRNLDLAKEFEFRSWKLLCSGEPAGFMTFGAMQQITFQILGHAPE
ncbi:MAG: hypothetical protein WBW81_08140, partial [Methylocella sp.]